MTNSTASLLTAARDRLHAAGISAAGQEIEYLHRWARQADDWESAFRHAVSRRAQRIPFSHISGRRAFWKHEFEVTPAVLDPRPESEVLIECSLRELANTPMLTSELRLLDLGCGSGCLLISLLAELPQATGVGIDCSTAALAVARRNVRCAGVQDRGKLYVGNWLDGVNNQYHVVVCNPPYIAQHEFANLEPEVAYAEPRGALDGGMDGLQHFRTIAKRLKYVLTPDGFACFEFGNGQADAVRGIFSAAELSVVAEETDLDGRPRCVVVRP